MTKVIYSFIIGLLFVAFNVHASLTLIYPNSGEQILGCTTQEISWTGNANKVNLYYSLDGGLYWRLIARNITGNYTYGNTYTYKWVAPQINSSQCLIKVENYTKSDSWYISKTPFTITSTSNASLQLISPIGGEEWGMASKKTIQWNSTGSISKVKIEYSKDNGASWTVLDSMAENTGSYSWVIQTNHGKNATSLIRIKDYINSCITDYSNSVFSLIEEPNLTLTNPSKGEKVFSSSIKNITWARSALPTPFVSLDYSLDSGKTWHVISRAENNFGTFAWIVPDTASQECLIKIYCSTDPKIADTTDIFNIIHPSITVQNINQNQKFTACQKTPINWTSEGTSPYVTIHYSTNGGKKWDVIANSLHSKIGLNTFDWHVPATSTSQCIIKISDVYSPRVFAVTESFIITNGIADNLSLTYPVGGDNIKTGNMTTIRWTGANLTQNIVIDYSKDAGLSWTNIATVPNTGRYDWSVPNDPSPEYLIKIRDASNPCILALSDSVFNVVAVPYYILTFPNTAIDTVYAGSVHTIRWTSGNNPGSARLYYSLDSGTTWNTISTFVTSNGSYNWTAPDTLISNCVIKITNLLSDENKIEDVSNQAFPIAKPKIHITYPNGGELVSGCTPVDISWTSLGLSQRINLYYSIDAGVKWSQITNNTLNNTNGINTYKWTPPSVVSQNCLIKVVDHKNPTYFAQTNHPFSITKTDTSFIEMVYPTGGEIWGTSRGETILWNSSGGISHVDISYTTNNGLQWLPINPYAPNTGSYTWTVPKTVSSQYLIRIRDYQKPCIETATPSSFDVISLPSIEVQSFDTRAILKSGNQTEIYWTNHFQDSSSLKIEYSVDSAKTWKVIESGINKTQRYTWHTPDEPSLNCFIKISQTDNPDIFDINNIPFAIIRPSLKLLYPTGGEELTGCTPIDIQWEGQPSRNTVHIQYSTDHGKTWEHIASQNIPVSGTSQIYTYKWSIPSIESSNFRLKIEDGSNERIQDINQESFSVKYSGNQIKITNPVTNENLGIASSKAITWTNTGTVLYVDLSYSISGGKIWNSIANSVPNTGSYLWTVPKTVSSNYKLKIQDYRNACIVDHATFNVVHQDYITVSWDNSFKEIRWINSSPDTASVHIDFSSDSMKTWTRIASNVANNGRYSYTMPNLTSDHCFFRVSSSINPMFYGTNPTPLLIRKSFTFTAPLGGEQLTGCQSIPVTWNSNGNTPVSIHFSSDNGINWKHIVSINSRSGVNTYNWQALNLDSDQCLIRLSHRSNSNIHETSTSTFSIRKNDHDLTLISPKANDLIGTSDKVNIQWETTGTIGKVNGYYSANGGQTWNPLFASSINNTGSYEWIVPNRSSENYLIRITNDTECIETVSDEFTVIDVPNFSITRPILGQEFISHRQESIQWAVYKMDVDTVAIEFSADSGITWSVIHEKIANNKSIRWNVPDTSTNKAVIRIKDIYSNKVYDQSSAFTIRQRSIRLINTINKETLTACTKHKISWTANLASSFSLFYSTDNGQNWKTIVSSLYNSADTIHYDWIVPTDYSDQCLIRVEESSIPSLNAISNQTFTITKSTELSLELLSPIGGETYKAATDKLIAWNTTGTVKNINLKYSANNGETWSSIVTQANSGSYRWRLPYVSSDKYLVSVSDAQNTCISDQSQQPFTIISIPTLSVTSPKLGDTLYSYNSYSVSVTKSNDATTYYLEYSTDSLKSWERVQRTNTSFIAPEIESDNCFIRANFGNFYGISSRFSIKKPTLIITSHQNGESLLGCQYYSIYWASKGTKGKLDLYYSIDNGKNWQLIEGGITTTNSYYWKAPAVISNQCRIKVVYPESKIEAINTKPFTINNGNNFIELISPKPGQKIIAGSNTTIQWEDSKQSLNINLQYSPDNGINWESIAYNRPNTGSYVWKVPTQTSTEALLRISDNYNTCIRDISNLPFSIEPALSLIYPNGNENLFGCSAIDILWSSQGSARQVSLQYSTDGGKIWNVIQSTVNNKSGINSYTWNTANVNTAQCIIRVTDISNKAIFDESNLPFSIERNNFSTITLTSPNGNEYWGTGKTREITWGSTNTSNSIKIEYTTNEGQSWYTIANGVPNTQSYSWTIPNAISSKAIVKLSDYLQNCITDQSDATFNIIPAPYITTSTFNTLEKVYIGTTKTISWNGLYLQSNKITLQYSTDSARTWKNIVQGYTQGSPYTWTIPDDVSKNCFIKILSTDDPSMFATNKAAFIIAKQHVTIQKPNGGEIWAACSQQRIIWNHEQATASVKISHSTDDGQTWNPIGTATYGGLGYIWTIPSTNLDGRHKIRIEDYSLSPLVDVSENYFTIIDNPATLTLTSLNGGQLLKGHDTTLISWSNTGTIKSVRLSYTLNNGITWININNNVPNSGVYKWQVPNSEYSTSVKIRIEDNEGCAKAISASSFTIQRVPEIIMYSPAEEEFLGIGNEQYIVWSAKNYEAQYAHIDYTLDDGITWTNIQTQSPVGQECLWIVPNEPYRQVRIRVRDYFDPSIEVISSKSYTIMPIELFLTESYKGQTLTSCTQKTITWHSSMIYSMNLFFSDDNGANWSNIATIRTSWHGQSDNEFVWTIPSLNSNECRLKLQTAYGQEVEYTSDVFSIRNNFMPSLKITSPALGTSWPSNSVQDIIWQSDTTVQYVDLYFSSVQSNKWIPITKGFKNTGKLSWPIPSSFQSGDVRLAITDIENRCNTDTSQTFHISGNSVITLLSPQGGEKLVSGLQFPIIWNSSFISSRIKLEYTTDHGTHWILISDTLPNTGKYNWIVPMAAQSNSVQIRISDAINSNVFDKNNHTFSISTPALMVTRPNGGEFWYGNTMKSIFWSASNIGSSHVKLEYSLDSAKTWLVISEKENNNGSYNWQLPNSGSINCFVKISDVLNPEIYDISDSVFTMVQPAFTILYPNGKESLKACSNNTITWTGQSTGKLYYSTDGGITWQNVAGGLVSSYSSLWSIPETSSTNCLIKIEDSQNPSIYDISDAPFTITNYKPRLELTSPNGGETWPTGKIETITWEASEEISFVKVEIAYKDSWNYNSINRNRSIPNTGFIDWKVFDSPGSASVKISDMNSCASDRSDRSFTIVKAPYITITSPDKVVQVVSGTTMPIQWSRGYLTTNAVDVSYSPDGGKNWTLIQEGLTNTSYTWTVPYIYSDNCLIKVADAGNPEVYDISDYAFTIARPIISDVRIANIEHTACTKTSIFWSGNSQNVHLYFSLDSGITWQTIEKNTRTNPYHWTIPQVSSTKCLIKITNPGDESIYALNNYMFTINNPEYHIALTNSFDEIKTGGLKTITWTASEDVKGVNLDYSIDNGTSWHPLSQLWHASSVDWIVPNMPSTNAIIRVSDLNSCASTTSSPFSIESVPYILVQNPKGGEKWYAGSTQEIKWNTGNLSNTVVNLHYSTDSGSTWRSIGTTAGNSFTWTVPNYSSSKVFVKISLASNPLIYGTNIIPISLSGLGLTLSYPNGGETLEACINSQIKWVANGVKSVYLYYSTDNGVTWVRIYQYPISLNEHYVWSLPELSTEKALIKVEDANDPTLFDISDSVFTIQNNTKATLTLLSFNNKEVLETYKEKVITWETQGSNIPYVQLSYSSTGGLTWTTISALPNKGTYTWKIPDTPTLSGLLRIRDLNSCASDESKSQFTIKSAPYIKITTPEGGERYSQSSIVHIYGMADNLNTTGIKLEFSSDSGKTWSLTENLIELSYYRSFNYKWIVPEITSSECFLKISDPFDPTVFHISGMFDISPANSVWPGDTDNNGIVDVYDLFPIGLHYGATGPSRELVSIDWAPYQAPEWNRIQANNIDLKYADCNGDGIIYYQDTLAIHKNYNFIRDNQSNLRIAAAENSSLYFVTSQQPHSDETTHIEIWAGNEQKPLHDIYGIAFKIEYPANAVEENSVQLNFSNNWIGELSKEAIAFQKSSQALGRIDGAITRIDYNGQSGYGKIADLYMRFKPNTQSLMLSFAGTKGINSEAEPIVFQSQDEEIDMVVTDMLTKDLNLKAQVFPNPSTGIVTISTNFSEAYNLSVNNSRGELILHKTSQIGKTQLDLNDLPKGVYFVKAEHGKGSIVKKLVLL